MPTIDLFYANGSGRIATTFTIDPRLVRGTRSSIGATLFINVQLPFAVAAPEIHSVEGSIRLAGEHDGLPIPAQIFVPNDSQLRVPLSDEQIARIERARGGRELMLELSLRATGCVTATEHIPMVFMSQHPLGLTIDRETWIRVLEALGNGRRRLIELPAPPADLGGRWNAAAAQIDAAGARLRIADAGAAMNETRTALERTLEAVALHLDLPPRGPNEGIRPVADRISRWAEKRHEPRSSDPYGAVAAAIALATQIVEFASDPIHRGLDTTEITNAELALSLVTTIYTYFGRLPPILSSTDRPRPAANQP